MCNILEVTDTVEVVAKKAITDFLENKVIEGGPVTV